MKGLYNILLSYRLKRAISMVGMSLLLMSGLFASVTFSQSFTSSVTTTLCKLFNTVHEVIFILGLTLMVVGAALYAGANVMPAAQKGQMQGYGMGMIFGGVIGVIIALAAPFILTIITGSSTIAATCATVGTF